MSFAKSAARSVLHSLGGIRFFRARNRRAVRILMYHNFPPDSSTFRSHCEHIRTFYAPVSMRQIGDALHRGTTLPDHAVAITVDDGYRDFLLNAFPVLSQHALPSTVFLVTDFMDRKSPLWWDALQHALEQTNRTVVAWNAPDGERSAPIRKADAKQQAWEIAQDLKEFGNDDRLRELAKIHSLLEAPPLEKWPADFEPMSWDEARALANQSVEFGAHTRTHAILSTIEDPRHLRDEIAGSRQRLIEEFEAPVLHFCYPNGRPRDIGEKVLAVTRESGFETGVTTVPGMNRIAGSAGSLELRRTPVTPDMPLLKFAELLAGVRDS